MILSTRLFSLLSPGSLSERHRQKTISRHQEELEPAFESETRGLFLFSVTISDDLTGYFTLVLGHLLLCDSSILADHIRSEN